MKKDSKETMSTSTASVATSTANSTTTSTTTTTKQHHVKSGGSGKASKSDHHRSHNAVDKSQLTSTKSEEASMKEKVRTLIEMSQRSEEEVCLALHDCDNDANLAINMLLEDMVHGEWETRVKKKKNRQTSASKLETSIEEDPLEGWGDNSPTPPVNDKEKSNKTSRGVSSGGGDRSTSNNRGWRGRERQENERNLTEGGGGPNNRRPATGGARFSGSTRGGGGGRGRGGGRAGGRYPPRGGNRPSSGGTMAGRFTKEPIDTWDNAASNTWDASNETAAAGDTNHTDGWDDYPGADEWSTEEYTGSLSDTKVFTASAPSAAETAADVPSAVPTPPVDAAGIALKQSVPSASSSSSSAVPNSNSSGTISVSGHISGTLNAAQTQYLTQLAQQNADTMKTTYSAATATNTTTANNSGAASVQYHGNNKGTMGSASVFSTGTQSVATTSQFGDASGGTQVAQQYTSAAYVGSTYGAAVNSAFGHNREQPQQQLHASTQSQKIPPQPSSTQTLRRAKTQRARVAPPSKIPSSAVEMPGDLNGSNIRYLDVQFGALDLMNDSGSFEPNSVSEAKYGSAVTGNSGSSSSSAGATKSVNAIGGLDAGTAVQVNNNAMDLNVSSGNETAASGLVAYSVKNSSVQSSISSALTQGLINTDSLPRSTDHLTGSYNAPGPRNTSSTGANVVASSVGIDMPKQSDYSQTSSYPSYQSKATNYPALSYSTSTQVTSSAYVGSQSNSHYANSGSSQPSGYSSASVNTYQNAYNTSGSSYQSSGATNTANNTIPVTYTSISQTNNSSYQPSANTQSYQSNTSNQSTVYGTGLSNTSSYGPPQSTTTQYSSYTPSRTKDSSSVYDPHNTMPSSTVGNASSSGQQTQQQSTASSTVSSSTAINSPTVPSSSVAHNAITSKTSASSASSQSAVMSLTKSSATSTASGNNNNNNNSSSMVSNLPPQTVPPVMGAPYIMGQVPYFQPQVYSYEDMQLLQQRLPHMTSYYDMSYQTPTSLTTVRDATLGNVAYSLSDGRYARGDNNASPVPSSLSQQSSTLTQGHQAQPILAAGTAAPQYFYPAPFNPIPQNYPFGTMYAQLPAATNTHGSNSNSQYPKAAAYGSGYGSYDALSQAQDYSKTGYVSGSQNPKGSNMNSTGNTSSTANDLSAMYGKSHATLSKVNSYDKQGFHSGTPPPYTGAMHGGQNTAVPPSGTSYAPQLYISQINPHQQQISTTHLIQHHQMDVRHQGRRMDSSNSGGSQRTQAVNSSKSSSGKQSYSASYWNQA